MKLRPTHRLRRRRLVSDVLPEHVYSVEQVRSMDRHAIEVLGIPGYELMCRAAAAALQALRHRWPLARRLVVVCGAGNNAGDGYVLARLAARSGYAVQVMAVTEPGQLKGDAARAWLDCAAAAVPIDLSGADPVVAPAADVVVDALLGTGVSRPLSERYATAVNQINATNTPVLALDVPSGLDANSGLPHGPVVRADMTVTFVGLKTGLFLGHGPDVIGQLHFDGLGITGAGADCAPILARLRPALLKAALPARRRAAHKGEHGRLLLVGGGPGMPGAIRLAAEAALRTGAGLVTVATHPDNRTAVSAARPEIICHGVTGPAQLDALVDGADAIAMGPGMGTGDWGKGLTEPLIGCSLPMVVDADGLNLLSHLDRTERTNWVLTPHPGEAARLLGTTAAEVQRDRLACVRELASRFAAVTVLKGAGTLIAAPPGETVADATVWVCDHGNPGMAVAGMGDVLTGAIAGLLVQLRSPVLAARAGVLAHALAGDDAACLGQRGMLALDMMMPLRRWVNH